MLYLLLLHHKIIMLFIIHAACRQYKQQQDT